MPTGDFHFSHFAVQSECAEPRVFVVSDGTFPKAFNLVGATLLDVEYTGGGVGKLFDLIAAAASVDTGSFQALLENLEGLSATSPVVLYVRGAVKLLDDIGPALLHIAAGWEAFAHHAQGVSAMYLVLDTGSRSIVDSAFYPGGTVAWR